MPLDPRIEEVRVRYGLAPTDFWELPQKKGTWVAKHAALEVVAVKANIGWTAPQIIEADGGNGVAALVVFGSIGERSEWSTGEASPKNNKNAYPWAMAEKRAKDRVILKLAGLHGLVYSDAEGDFDRSPEPAVDPLADVPASSEADMRGKMLQKERKDLFNDWYKELESIPTLARLNLRIVSQPFLNDMAKLSEGNRQLMRDHINALRAIHMAAGQKNNYDDLEPNDVPADLPEHIVDGARNMSA